MSVIQPEVDVLVRYVLEARVGQFAAMAEVVDAEWVARAQRIWSPTGLSPKTQSARVIDAVEKEMKARGFETRRFRNELQIRKAVAR